ncbi:FMN-dependent NADH-azoreductase [Methylibium sp.]|uniref:FMN-dependent NADH-azoreductase n=1 Tax=Methylibium sp. TaxID=2067992 RepID=UPI003D0CC169
MNLLHIDSSILGDASVSRMLSAKIVEKCRAEMPGLTVTYRDLAEDPVSHISGDYFMALTGAQIPRRPELERELARGDALLSEFLAADIYVLGLPMYNWTVPSNFKAWFDRICIVGKTFRYTGQGYEGLVGDKPMIVASTRGGFYTPGNPGAVLDHHETYVRNVFGVLGVTKVNFVRAEGVGISEAVKARSIEDALRQATESQHLAR